MNKEPELETKKEEVIEIVEDCVILSEPAPEVPAPETQNWHGVELPKSPRIWPSIWPSI